MGEDGLVGWMCLESLSHHLSTVGSRFLFTEKISLSLLSDEHIVKEPAGLEEEGPSQSPQLWETFPQESPGTHGCLSGKAFCFWCGVIPLNWVT